MRSMLDRQKIRLNRDMYSARTRADLTLRQQEVSSTTIRKALNMVPRAKLSEAVRN